MPVDPDHEVLWPIGRAVFTTNDDQLKAVVLAELPNPGDVVSISGLHVIGRIANGFAGAIHLGNYTGINVRGSLESRGAGTTDDPIGAGGLSVSVTPVGLELHLVVRGLALVPVMWAVSWLAVSFPVVESAAVAAALVANTAQAAIDDAAHAQFAADFAAAQEGAP